MNNDLVHKLLATNDYRQVFHHFFYLRQKKNSKYTYNALARDIHLTSARLNDIIHKRAGVSLNVAVEIADRLNLQGSERNVFCLLVESEHGRAKRSRENALSKINEIKNSFEFKSMDIEVFKAINRWEYWAVLHLTDHKDFQPDGRWIARQLNISQELAESVFQSLLDLKLIDKSENGHCKISNPHLQYGVYNTPDQMTQFQLQMIERAQSSVLEQQREQRFLASAAVSFPKKRMPEAQKRIGEFYRGFIKEFGSGPDCDSVYSMTLQFFELRNEKQ